jgi:hypothetical protein
MRLNMVSMNAIAGRRRAAVRLSGRAACSADYTGHFGSGNTGRIKTMGNDRLKFEIDCPNNHNQTVSFTEAEFEDWLKSSNMVFHCNTCDTDFPPSKEDIAKFRREFAKLST